MFHRIVGYHGVRLLLSLCRDPDLNIIKMYNLFPQIIWFFITTLVCVRYNNFFLTLFSILMTYSYQIVEHLSVPLVWDKLLSFSGCYHWKLVWRITRILTVNNAYFIKLMQPNISYSDHTNALGLKILKHCGFVFDLAKYIKYI